MNPNKRLLLYAGVFIGVLVCALLLMYVLIAKTDPGARTPTATSSDVLPFPLGTEDGTSTAATVATTSSASSTIVRTLRPLPDDIFEHLKAIWYTFDSEGTIVGTRTKEYSLTYSKRFDLFTVTISSEPSAQYRQDMEQALLESLDVSHEEACTLRVQVNRRTAHTFNNFQSIGLSFCPGSVSDSALTEPFVE